MHMHLIRKVSKRKGYTRSLMKRVIDVCPASCDFRPRREPGAHRIDAMPCFYSVVHTFNDGKAEGFWTNIQSMKPEDWPALTKKNNDLGFHNHSFMPAAVEGPINCLWECKDETNPEAFQKFIDGPDGPGEGVFVNKCYRVMPGGITPAPYDFGKREAAAPKATTGAMFWVLHEFKEGAAPPFWEMIQGMKPKDWPALTKKNNDLGFENHSFCPAAPEGPVICIWESKAPMEIAEFQAFIDGPDGPGAGKTFNNTVNKSMAGGITPSAKFTA